MTWSEEGTWEGCPSVKQLDCFISFQSFYGGHKQNTIFFLSVPTSIVGIFVRIYSAPKQESKFFNFGNF